jgi:superfamily I DNA and/or RNA helicase
MWCNEKLKNAVDFLFIDEAGQFALIDTVVVSHAAKNIILLGDHQQLKQPIKGVHPEGTEVSVLEHLLEGKKTIPEEKGIFLEETWRMHPDICSFDSDMFYESRLHSVDGLENQKVEGNTIYKGSGLFYKSVIHEGNTNLSIEEIDAIEKIIQELTKGDVFWFDEKNNKHLLQHTDIKIITPYNSNVFELQKRMPNVEIGTVDKFQGQEAPVIIYSLASSTPEDAPRGMDFLYSPNRFNVAVSRAKVIFIMVGNPRLFEPDCKSPEQIKLANPFCRFMELATIVP